MKKLVIIINKTLKFLNINYSIFSKFSIDYKNEKDDNFNTKIIFYNGYHKDFDKKDWRFSENNLRKNVVFLNLKLIKFMTNQSFFINRK